MLTGNYWQKLTQSRISRRRAISGGAGLGLSAAALSLIGCGNDDDNGGGSSTGGGGSGATSLLHDPKVTTSKAKAGGTLKHYEIGDATHFDAVSDSSATVVRQSASVFYPRLLRMAPAEVPDDADGSSLGEAAESWEVSGDKLTVTFKLRQGMVWDRRAPTNGRQIDADDVVFSYNKYKQLNSNASALDATKAPDSPVQSITASDPKTVVVKLSQPYASIIPMFSANDLLYIMPRESDGGFDPRSEVRGHGPFLLDNYTPSASFTWAKNPDFYIKDRPFMDRVELPIVTDYVQRLAQFKAGNIYTDVLLGNQEDIVVSKRDVPDAWLLQEAFTTTSTNLTTFGWEEGVAWRDVRVRQALSMLIDREAYIDVIDNRENFARDGLDISVRQNSIVPGGWTNYWLDPTDNKAFGDSAKYLQLNVEEAKKLLSAAGIQPGKEFNLYMGPPDRYGTVYQRTVELYDGFFRNAGLQPKVSVITPADTWLTKYSRIYRTSTYKPGDGFDGLAVIPERGYVTAALQIYNQLHKDGGSYRGAVYQNGKTTDGDPKMNDLAVKIAQEYNQDKQIDLVHEAIRYATEQMYFIPKVSSAKPFTLWWPAVGNAGAYNYYPNSGAWVDQKLNWWIDTSQKPLAG
jgi:ABC-type transport system substrate-binding protein